MPLEIVSKEALTKPILWPMLTVACITIAGLIVLMCILGLKKNINMRKIISALGWIGGGGIGLMLIAALVTGIFFRVPSNTFRYEIKINPEVMTLQQLEDFKHSFRPESCHDKVVYTFTSSKDLSAEDIIQTLNEK